MTKCVFIEKVKKQQQLAITLNWIACVMVIGFGFVLIWFIHFALSLARYIDTTDYLLYIFPLLFIVPGIMGLLRAKKAFGSHSVMSSLSKEEKLINVERYLSGMRFLKRRERDGIYRFSYHSGLFTKNDLWLAVEDDRVHYCIKTADPAGLMGLTTLRGNRVKAKEIRRWFSTE